MKKILKSRIFLVIITIILTLGTTVCGAILYNANQVSYTPSDTNWNVDTVDGALNDLYNTANTKLNSTTAEAGDILSGKTAYSRGSLVTGTMANRGAVNATINPGASYTIPAGYHNGFGTVTANDSGSKPTLVKSFFGHGSNMSWAGGNTFTMERAGGLVVNYASGSGYDHSWVKVNGTIVTSFNTLIELKAGDVVQSSYLCPGYNGSYACASYFIIYF